MAEVSSGTDSKLRKKFRPDNQSPSEKVISHSGGHAFKPVQLRATRTVDRIPVKRKRTGTSLDLSEVSDIVQPKNYARRRKSSMEPIAYQHRRAMRAASGDHATKKENKCVESTVPINCFLEFQGGYASLDALLAHNNSEYKTKPLPAQQRHKRTVKRIRRRKSDSDSRDQIRHYQRSGALSVNYENLGQCHNAELEELCSQTLKDITELFSLRREGNEQQEKIRKLESTIKDLETVHSSALLRIEKLKNLLEKFKVELRTTSQALQFSQSQLNKERLRGKLLAKELEELTK